MRPVEHLTAWLICALAAPRPRRVQSTKQAAHSMLHLGHAHFSLAILSNVFSRHDLVQVYVSNAIIIIIVIYMHIFIHAYTYIHKVVTLLPGLRYIAILKNAFIIY